ncbi:hypothetical protein CKAN_01898300 [Cinnamomum micranthum f. kanehirae]|uniref:Uncharacterized protein n=1 Tax=Cinnamomum micranthum f. kanehirae TaxID=337451 RepID=A0A3S3ND75_9MAGN|nr:hypothetical protein CKAN_01898300 [Cinnamomum micranthum f. kanehirae]
MQSDYKKLFQLAKYQYIQYPYSVGAVSVASNPDSSSNSTADMDAINALMRNEINQDSDLASFEPRRVHTQITAATFSPFHYRREVNENPCRCLLHI